METQVLSLKKEALFSLAQFLAMVFLMSFVPALIHNQFVTGPMVNAILFLSTYFFSLRDSLLLAMLPSIFAALSGLLNPALVPMVPNIIISNFILIISFKNLKDKNYWLAVLTSSFLKFVFLFLSSSIFMNLFFKKDLPAKIAQTMSWPQLATALAGGVIAYFILKKLNRK